MPVTVIPSGAALGAEIVVDLSRDIDDATFAEIHDAFHDNIVVAFRDQHLSNEKHVEFRRRFGELEVHIVKKYLLPDYPEILMISLSVTKRVNKLVSPMPIHLAQRGVLPKGS